MGLTLNVAIAHPRPYLDNPLGVSRFMKATTVHSTFHIVMKIIRNIFNE